jgi:hypothetical protein
VNFRGKPGASPPTLRCAPLQAHNLKLVVATTTQLAPTTRRAGPLALWHLLSLDAPTVAALWVWFIARSAHICLPFAAPTAMALAVWMLYAADRLLDTRHLDHPREGTLGEYEARHLFHHRHRRLFLLGIASATMALAALLHTLDPAAIHLYLIEAALLFAWFVVLHATRSAHRLPKEIAVGIFFSAAVFIPAIAREPSLRPSLAPAAILFAAVCSLNCLLIYAWEHDETAAEWPRTQLQPPHLTTRLAIAHLPSIAAAIAVGGLVLALLEVSQTRTISSACAISAVLLLVLDRSRRHISRATLRAAADLALLTPLLLLPLLQ